MPGEPLAVQLGNFVAALRFDDLPASVVDKGKAVLNHALTVGLASHSAPRLAAAVRAVLLDEQIGPQKVGKGQGATLWMDGRRVTRVGAAFGNAVAVQTNNQCDSYYMLTHPGVLNVPTGIAIAEGEGRSGKELLTALVAGYEVQCRCARDFIPSTPAHGFRASPVYGILGCAATAAKLLRLSAEQTVNAISIAASFAGSLIEGQRAGADDHDFAEAQAARSGVWAASLAAQGFRGAATALEGAGGFYYAFTGSNEGNLTYAFQGPLKASLDEIVADLGKRWEILKVKFKVFPTPGFNQPVVWLARDMVTKHRLAADDIERITLELNYLETTYPTPRFPRSPGPTGEAFARTHYILAYTVVTGDYPYLERNYEDPRAASDPQLAARVADLKKRVEVIGTVNRDHFSPRLTFYLRDGTHYTAEYHGKELMWDFAKDAHNLRGFIPGLAISSEQYDRLVAVIAALESTDSVDELVRLTIVAN